MTVRYQSAVLFVADIGRAKAFYVDVLGQQVLMDHGPNVGFVGGFALWQADAVEQVASVQTGVNDQPLGRDNLELYFEADDLVEMVMRLQERDVALVHPLLEQPWGQRTIRCYDPDGHIVEVGEPMPAVVRRLQGAGMGVEEIAGKTAMPVGVVTAMLGG